MATGGNIGEIIPKAKLSKLYKNVGWFEDVQIKETETVGHNLTGKIVKIGIATEYGATPVLVLSSDGSNPLIQIRDQTNPNNHGWFDIICPETNFSSIPVGDYVFDMVVIEGTVREGWLRGEIQLEYGVVP